MHLVIVIPFAFVSYTKVGAKTFRRVNATPFPLGVRVDAAGLFLSFVGFIFFVSIIYLFRFVRCVVCANTFFFFLIYRFPRRAHYNITRSNVRLAVRRVSYVADK